MARVDGTAWRYRRDFNLAPDDIDVSDPGAWHGGTHVSERGIRRCIPMASSEARAVQGRDYRAVNFHKNFGMRIDHLLVTAPLRHRVVWAEIDREARKGKPLPQITHRWSSTSTALAIRSMPAGLRQIRVLRCASEGMMSHKGEL